MKVHDFSEKNVEQITSNRLLNFKPSETPSF